MQALSDLSGVASVVELEQAVEHLLPRHRRERVANAEFRLVEVVTKFKVPTVGGPGGVVEVDVDLAQAGNVVGTLVGVMDAVVGLRQTLLAVEHQRAAVGVELVSE